MVFRQPQPLSRTLCQSQPEPCHLLNWTRAPEPIFSLLHCQSPCRAARLAFKDVLTETILQTCLYSVLTSPLFRHFKCVTPPFQGPTIFQTPLSLLELLTDHSENISFFFFSLYCHGPTALSWVVV